MYQFYKHYTAFQRNEYKWKYMLMYLLQGSKLKLPLRLLYLPYKLLQHKESEFYAQQLMARGVKYE